MKKMGMQLLLLRSLLVVGMMAQAGTFARAQGPDELVNLDSQIAKLYQAGKYSEATEIAKRALILTESHYGPAHLEVGASLNNLAALYLKQGRHSDAEPLMIRALSIDERVHGPDHKYVGQSLNVLAEIYRTQGRYWDAEPLFKRSLAIREKTLGPDHPDVATSLNNLSLLYQARGQVREAEMLAERALAIREKALGPKHPNVGSSLGLLAVLYKDQGRYSEAELLLKRSLSVSEQALGGDHPDIGSALNNLANLYQTMGRLSDAEPLYQRALTVLEKSLGPDHPDLGVSLNNLAAVYRDQGRYNEAEPLHKRSLAILEKALTPDHPSLARTLNEIAWLYQSQMRHAEAEPYYKRALSIQEKTLGPNHPGVAATLNDIALLYLAQGRAGEGEAIAKRALTIFETVLGNEHPSVATAVNSLAGLYRYQGRYREAEILYTRSLNIYGKALGAEHSDIAVTLSNLASLSYLQNDWAQATAHWRRSTAVIVRRGQRGTDDVGQALTGKRKSDAEQLSYQFRGLVKAAYRLASSGVNAAEGLPREMFRTAQWAQGSEAGASLAQMAARGAKGDPGLATIVRERQDLVAEWQKLDGARTAAVSQAPDKRDRAAEAANIARLAAIDARIADIDKRLAADFPDYAALSRPEPLSVEEVQAQLRPDEALVLFLDTQEWQPTPEETFIWVVTKTDVRSVRSELGTPALTRDVAALRCGLDASGWEGEGAAKCAGHLKIAPDKVPKGNAPLPFDIARAHALYNALFGQVEDLIRDKHLLIVPSGPLTQLPFQVLVTASPANGDYRSAAWLARKHPITVLPAVSSLKALRRIAKPSAATKPMIGFGNPLLDGDPAERPWEADWAKLARQKQSCPQTPWKRVAALFERPRGVVPMATRSGRPDLDHLRGQAPLHDTADELCAVAKDLKLASDDIVLGDKATEATIKRLSGEGKLAGYRVVHFATHGTLSGEISGTSEPGLILTPPTEQTEIDDGYLSASEVAGLKLDADWVILSACNTAAGGAAGAEALSGLARAFIYAGARAMLVSHWAVDSAATVKLISHAVGATARDKTLGRSEALRHAMLAMIDKGEAREAHPAYWAPFVVVGEGAAAK